jgi:hypothetical protein
MLSAGGITAGVLGLVAIAALLLLLFLCRKKEKEEEENEELPEQTTLDLPTELGDFISQYGLCDPGELDGGPDDEDLPAQVSNDSGDWREGNGLHGSEHNPDDFEEFNSSTDET